MIRTDLCETQMVKGSEFLRKLRGWRLESDSTILKDPKKELGAGLLRSKCRDLGIEPRDL